MFMSVVFATYIPVVGENAQLLKKSIAPKPPVPAGNDIPFVEANVVSPPNFELFIVDAVAREPISMLFVPLPKHSTLLSSA